MISRLFRDFILCFLIGEAEELTARSLDRGACLSELGGGTESLVLLSGDNMFPHAWSVRESEASEFVPLAIGDAKVAFSVAAGLRFSGNVVFLMVELDGEVTVTEAVTLGRRMNEGME